MKTNRVLSVAILTSAALLTSCSKSPEPAPGQGTPATNASAAGEVKAAAVAAAQEVATEVKKQAVETAKSISQQLTAAAPGDATLQSIGQDLDMAVQKLQTSVRDNAALKDQLNAAVQALLGTKDLDAFKAMNQLSSAKLTPEQTQLVKDTYNIASAYVTQRNFSSLEGAQGEVSQIVNSLRKGEVSQLLTPLQKISQNAKLTTGQKDVLAALSAKYAPGLKDAAATLQGSVDPLKKVSP